MQVATSNRLQGIIAECGGELICATCHVFVDNAWLESLPEMLDDEAGMLNVTSEEPTHESRLSCQITITEHLDGLVVRIPPTQR